MCGSCIDPVREDFADRLSSPAEEIGAPFVVLGVAYGRARARRGRTTDTLHAVTMAATADAHGFRHLADYRKVTECVRQRIDQSMERTGFSDGGATSIDTRTHVLYDSFTRIKVWMR